MAENSAIEWTDHTWSPWIGCQKVGPGCDHCYAESLNKRTGGGNWGPGAPRRRTSQAYWREPYRWNNAGRCSVFPSLCDPFDNAVPAELRRDFGWLIRETPNITWLLLTKRIGNATEMMAEMFAGSTPENVWLGATIVNQAEADRYIPKLLATPARVRFLSMEPLLGPVDLTDVKQMVHGTCAHMQINALTGALYDVWGGGPKIGDGSTLDWIIVGGESGPSARITPISAVRSLRDQCAAADVAFLHKQHGEWIHESQVRWLDPMLDTHNCRWEIIDGESYYRIGKKAAGRLLDGVQHDGFPTHDGRRSRGG